EVINRPPKLRRLHSEMENRKGNRKCNTIRLAK
ncbi:hypothetical protein SCA6_013555, partial [Theobroma cacao]